jgi:hypothetical protein
MTILFNETMQHLRVEKPINASLFCQEVGSALGVDVYLNPEGDGLWLYFPVTLSAEQMQDLLDAHDAAAETSQQRIRRQVAAIAQSAVEVRLVDLSPTQIKALLAILLYHEGAIDAQNMTVRPLSEWV